MLPKNKSLSSFSESLELWVNSARQASYAEPITSLVFDNFRPDQDPELIGWISLLTIKLILLMLSSYGYNFLH